MANRIILNTKNFLCTGIISHIGGFKIIIKESNILVINTFI